MDLASLSTPSLILDHARFRKNVDRVYAKLLRHPGVSLRPHLKTVKSIDAAREIIRYGLNKATVSTLREAEYFAENGVTDILYAVAAAPAKLDRIGRLIDAGVRMCVVVDDIGVARSVTEWARGRERPIGVMIEIDSDGHRSGVTPEDEKLIKIADALGAKEGVDFVGVMTHAGESYRCKTREAIADMAERERSGAVGAADRIRRAGIACNEVSVGSTPTFLFAKHLEGVTEARVGVAYLNDLTMAGLGVCGLEDIAISVLATIIGHQRDKNRIIVDAGWMALSSDCSAPSQRVFAGLGVVADIGGRIIPGLGVLSANQEHGIISSADGGALDFAGLPVGGRLRIYPNHACATAAAFREYKVVTSGDEVVATWSRCAGW
jgi:D-serine deaminase-like pyridoxal phosphate-dependent protein